MFRKMMVLALLFPGLGGCIWREDRGRHEGGREHHSEVEVRPVHVHGVGCGHVFRGGVWITVG